jgi:hypothetical protein
LAVKPQLVEVGAGLEPPEAQVARVVVEDPQLEVAIQVVLELQDKAIAEVLVATQLSAAAVEVLDQQVLIETVGSDRLLMLLGHLQLELEYQVVIPAAVAVA